MSIKSHRKIIAHSFASSINIIPIADVHLGSMYHQEKEWNQFLKNIQSLDNTYLILAGDLINNNTRSSVGSPFDDILRPREQKRIMTEMLAPIRDKILCIVSGNHENRSLKDADDDPTYDIACKLDLEDIYREDLACNLIRVGHHTRRTSSSGGSHVQAYSIVVTHGSGGGIYTGASVNRNERFANVFDNLDCLITGHSHKPSITRPTKEVIDSRSLSILRKEVVCVTCASWLDYSGYALRKQLLPTASSSVMMLTLSDDSHKKYIKTTW